MKTFVVLGMHRSATSLAAKGLHDSGVFMGEDLIGACPSNIYGHYENRRFVELNNAILLKSGGSWDNPPAEEKILDAGKQLKNRIEQTIAQESANREFWGWKDPRTTLTIKCYWNYLENPHVIACFRNPVQIAQSLQKRDGTPLAQGIRLATEYNRRLFDFLNKHYMTGAAIVDVKKEKNNAEKSQCDNPGNSGR